MFSSFFLSTLVCFFFVGSKFSPVFSTILFYMLLFFLVEISFAVFSVFFFGLFFCSISFNYSIVFVENSGARILFTTFFFLCRYRFLHVLMFSHGEFLLSVVASFDLWNGLKFQIRLKFNERVCLCSFARAKKSLTTKPGSKRDVYTHMGFRYIVGILMGWCNRLLCIPKWNLLDWIISSNAIGRANCFFLFSCCAQLLIHTNTTSFWCNF